MYIASFLEIVLLLLLLSLSAIHISHTQWAIVPIQIQWYSSMVGVPLSSVSVSGNPSVSRSLSTFYYLDGGEEESKSILIIITILFQ